MNLKDFTHNMLTKAYVDNPELAEQLYTFRKTIMAAELAMLERLYPGKKFRDLTTLQFGTIIWNLCKEHDTDAELFIEAYAMDTTPLRLEFDEEYTELIYHGNLHEGGW